MRGLEHHRLEHALRPDDDVRQRERVVGERREQLGVERTRAGVPFPAQPTADDLVHALGRERRDQAVDIAPILGDGMALPESPNRTMHDRVRGPTQSGADGLPRRPDVHFQIVPS